MNLILKKAKIEDAKLLVEIYNSAFYDDFIKYGECPAYGRSIESMKNSISKFEKHIIFKDNIPVGVISVKKIRERSYYIGCLCVIPKFQHIGIGTYALNSAMKHYTMRHAELITPSDKTENITFYEKNGFCITERIRDGNVFVTKLEFDKS